MTANTEDVPVKSTLRNAIALVVIVATGAGSGGFIWSNLRHEIGGVKSQVGDVAYQLSKMQEAMRSLERAAGNVKRGDSLETWVRCDGKPGKQWVACDVTIKER